MEKKKFHKPSLKRDKRAVTYLNDSQYKRLNAICIDREATEAEVLRDALDYYFKNNH